MKKGFFLERHLGTVETPIEKNASTTDSFPTSSCNDQEGKIVKSLAHWRLAIILFKRDSQKSGPLIQFLRNISSQWPTTLIIISF